MSIDLDSWEHPTQEFLIIQSILSEPKSVSMIHRDTGFPIKSIDKALSRNKIPEALYCTRVIGKMQCQVTGRLVQFWTASNEIFPMEPGYNEDEPSNQLELFD
jgi:hypothetical protein